MIRSILLIITSFFVCISMRAEDSTVMFTYAGNSIGVWGTARSQIYDTAIRIDDPSLIGKKIIGIRAYLNACDSIESTSIWLSKELSLKMEDGIKVNDPDVFSKDVAPEPFKFQGLPDMTFATMWVDIENEPYVITEEGIYVGYSLRVPSVKRGESLTEKQKYPLLFSSCENPNALFLRTSKDFINWTAANDQFKATAMIYVLLEGDFIANGVRINSIENEYIPLNEEVSLRASLSNIGYQEALSIDYDYILNGEKHEHHLDFATPLPADPMTSNAVDLPVVPFESLGLQTMDINISKVNGAVNEADISSATGSVTVLPYIPTHRPLVEEFTGTWCAWCPRGYISFELLGKSFGDDVVLAAYHNKDPMEVTKDYPVRVPGFPLASLNRNGTEDPYYGKSDTGFGMKNELSEIIKTVVPADISLTAQWDDTEKEKIIVNSKTSFFFNEQDVEYKIGFLLINNGLRGPENDMQWWQQNAYAKEGNKYEGTELEVLTTWPILVPDLTFNDVVVDVSAMKGLDGSLPSTISFNTPYDTEFTFDIAGNEIIQDKNNLWVVGVIINPDGTILNANKTHVEGDTGVATVSSNVLETQYFNLSGQNVSNPSSGVFIKVTKISDGSVITEKIIR